jgi:hypothetical protein
MVHVINYKCCQNVKDLILQNSGVCHTMASRFLMLVVNNRQVHYNRIPYNFIAKLWTQYHGNFPHNYSNTRIIDIKPGDDYSAF